jgi:chromate transporter
MTSAAPPIQPSQVGFGEALMFWLKLGFISFGGQAGQIAIMHEELVERRRWISERRFPHALNYCMVLPVPEAQQLATYIEWLTHGVKGGLVAGALFVLLSVFILIALSWIYLAFGQLPAIAGMLHGIKPAVTAIVLFAAYRIGSRALKNAWAWVIATASFIAIFALEIPFPIIVLAAAVIGAIGGKFSPEKFRAGGGHGSGSVSSAPALIDDDTPTPAHARLDRNKLAAILAIGLLLWASALAILTWRFGWTGAFTQMGWFFTKAALLTFGGAYAVLPYVYQGAVENYTWLTATQMID